MDRTTWVYLLAATMVTGGIIGTILVLLPRS